MSSLLSWKWENWKQIALSQMWLFYIDTSCYFLFLLMSSAEKRRNFRIFFLYVLCFLTIYVQKNENFQNSNFKISCITFMSLILLLSHFQQVSNFIYVSLAPNIFSTFFNFFYENYETHVWNEQVVVKNN